MAFRSAQKRDRLKYDAEGLGIGMVEKTLERKGMIRRWLKNKLAVSTIQQVPPGRVE